MIALSAIATQSHAPGVRLKACRNDERGLDSRLRGNDKMVPNFFHL